MISIAIDGPAGAGKSTIAKEASKRLSYIYVDTGALYRAIAYYMVKNNISGDEFIVLSLKDIKIDLNFINGEQRVFLCGEDVSEKIRTPEISMNASKISAIPEVRNFLLDLQRNIAKNNNIIMDGRDIGTVVLPFADVKIFLTASIEKRAKRRYIELTQKGVLCNYDEVLKDMKKRDSDDSNRKTAPLRPANDAIIIDTSECSLDESIELILNTIKNKLRQV
mgnify:FL=1